MKNLYLLLFLFVSVFMEAQIVDIPDTNFKFNLISGNNVDNDGDGNYDEDVDTNGDGEVQVSEAEAVIRLFVQNTSFTIGSLEGIGSFINLEDFHSNNDITTADFSQNANLINLDMFANECNNVILPVSSTLEEVLLSSNHITSLDLSQSPNIEKLSVSNTQITSLDLHPVPNLRELIAVGLALNDIDLSQNIELREIFLTNCNLTSIDVSQSPSLRWLSIGGNSISEIDLSQNGNLRLLGMRYNPIQSLDLTQNALIHVIEVRNTQLTSLNIQNGNNQVITELRTYNNPGLDCIQVDDVEYSYAQGCDKTGYYGWCVSANTVYSADCSLGVEDQSFIDFALFPNPVQSVLQIESTEVVESIEIYTLEGKLIKEASSALLDVSELSKGLYFIRAFIGDKSLTKKFIKE